LRRVAQEHFLKMLDSLRDGQSTEPFTTRLQTALENPLSRDPDHAMRFRHFTARLLRGSITADKDGTLSLSPEMTRDALLALDARFGWLNDYAAFRQDFGDAPALQDLIIRRAYDHPALDITYAAHEPKKSSIDGRVLAFGAFALLKFVSLASSNARSFTATDLWAYGALIGSIAALYWLFKQLGKKFNTAFAAILTGWFGVFLPVAVLSQFSDDGENFSILAAWLFVTAAFALPIVLPKLWQHLRSPARAKPPANHQPIPKRAKIEFLLLATLAAAVLCILGVSMVNEALAGDTTSLQNLASTMIVYGGLYAALGLWQRRKPIGLSLGIALWFGLGALELFFPLNLVTGTTDNSPLVAWMAITLLVWANRLMVTIASKIFVHSR
jgi:hypothetical protein